MPDNKLFYIILQYQNTQQKSYKREFIICAESKAIAEEIARNHVGEPFSATAALRTFDLGVPVKRRTYYKTDISTLQEVGLEDAKQDDLLAETQKECEQLLAQAKQDAMRIIAAAKEDAQKFIQDTKLLTELAQHNAVTQPVETEAPKSVPIKSEPDATDTAPTEPTAETTKPAPETQAGTPDVPPDITLEPMADTPVETPSDVPDDDPSYQEDDYDEFEDEMEFDEFEPPSVDPVVEKLMQKEYLKVGVEILKKHEISYIDPKTKKHRSINAYESFTEYMKQKPDASEYDTMLTVFHSIPEAHKEFEDIIQHI